MQTVTKKEIEAQEPNLLTQVWFKYSPYWPIFIFFLATLLTGAWLFVRYKTTPVYEATAAILVQDTKKGQDESKMMEQLDQLSAKKIVENEIEVIKSRELMYDVVKNLHLYVDFYQEGKIKPSGAYTTTPVTLQARFPDSLHATDKIFFTIDAAKTKVTINNASYAVNEWVKTPYGTLKFIPQNLEKSDRPSPFYFTLNNPRDIAGGLSMRLNASAVSKLASVIELKIQDENYKKASDILNELMEAYKRAAIKEKHILASNTLAFVEERLQYVKHDLDSIENKLKQYKGNQGATDIGSQAQIYLQNVSELNKKAGDVNVQIDVLDQVENYVKSKNSQSAIVPSIVGVSDPTLTQLVEKLSNKQLEYDKLVKTTGENNPMALSLKGEIDKLSPSILETVRNQRSSLATERSSLNGLTGKFSSMLGSIPQKERDLVEISREQNIKSGIYNFLLQKKEETALALTTASTDTDSRIVDKAKSDGPMSPAKKIYAAAFLLALGIPAGLITAKELFKRTILFRQEIEKMTNVPVIGEIVHDKSKESIVIGDGKRTFIAEQFRNLRTSLPYIGIKGDKKKILVTSTIAGEGKSFVVANLGVSLAITGKKVIVLEFDLSNPSLCNKLGVEREKGLSDFINGEVRKDEIVKQVPGYESLFIISAGSIPDNPSELITSEKVPELLNYLSVFYDYIVVDTAPVGLLSDGYILSSYCDASLYVVRHGHTPKVAIQRIDENNSINELKNLAIVFNGVRPRGFSKNAYGYGYGYGYGYAYKDGRKKTKKKSLTRSKVA